MNVLGQIKQYSAYRLSELADTGSPDDHGSDGAVFLTDVRDDLVDRIQHHLNDGDELGDVLDSEGERIRNEVSDSAPAVSTHLKWKQFVDLTAYTEDLSDHGTPTDNTPGGWADMALVQIAYRLLDVLMDEIEDSVETETEEV